MLASTCPPKQREPSVQGLSLRYKGRGLTNGCGKLVGYDLLHLEGSGEMAWFPRKGIFMDSWIAGDYKGMPGGQTCGVLESQKNLGMCWNGMEGCDVTN